LLAGDDLLDPVNAERVTECAIAEFARKDPLLLLFHASPHLECRAHDAIQRLVRNAHFAIGKEQLDQPAHRPLHRLDITSGQRTTPENAVLQNLNTTRRSQSRPALAQEIAHKAEVTR